MSLKTFQSIVEDLLFPWHQSLPTATQCSGWLLYVTPAGWKRQIYARIILRVSIHSAQLSSWWVPLDQQYTTPVTGHQPSSTTSHMSGPCHQQMAFERSVGHSRLSAQYHGCSSKGWATTTTPWYQTPIRGMPTLATGFKIAAAVDCNGGIFGGSATSYERQAKAGQKFRKKLCNSSRTLRDFGVMLA